MGSSRLPFKKERILWHLRDAIWRIEIVTYAYNKHMMWWYLVFFIKIFFNSVLCRFKGCTIWNSFDISWQVIYHGIIWKRHQWDFKKSEKKIIQVVCKKEHKIYHGLMAHFRILKNITTNYIYSYTTLFASKAIINDFRK